MKPTAEQIAEAAKRGIVPGAVIDSPVVPNTGTIGVVTDHATWVLHGNGDIVNGDHRVSIYCGGEWATVITPAPSVIEDRIAAAEASLQRLDDAIAELRAMIGKPMVGHPVEAPQGLQEGDYCDASKEVADALTAMGLRIWGMGLDKKYYVWDGQDKDIVPLNSPYAGTLLDAPTFLFRARVTAAELGLKAPEPWTPKFGDRVMTPRGEGIYWYRPSVGYVVIFEGGCGSYTIDQLRPIKP